MRRTTYVLLGALLTLGTTIWAADIDYAGNPAAKDGSLWARKSGTTNTKQDITSHSNALDVNVASTTGTTTVAGSDSDNAANSTTKVPVIPCRANAAAPTWTEGREAPCSVDLSGSERVSVTTALPAGTNLIGVTGVGQASTTSGQSGPLMQGAVTTAAPSYTTAQTSPLSLTTGGALRTSSAESNWPTTVDTNNGAVSASTPRVTIASDSTGQIIAKGAAASGAAVSGNPVLIAGSDGTNARTLTADTTGRLTVGGGAAMSPADGVTNAGNGMNFLGSAGNNGTLQVWPGLFNGTSWDRQRTAGIGNGVAATGIAAASPYGEYLTNANQVALTTGQYGAAQVDSAGNLRTAPQRPTATDILDGRQTFTSTTGATTIVTVSAGRTWTGTINLTVDCDEAAAGTAACKANAAITTAGTNVTPAAGTYFVCQTTSGANAATGVVGSQGSNFCSTPFTIVAPAGNTVTIQVTTTQAGTASLVEASAIGVMQ